MFGICPEDWFNLVSLHSIHPSIPEFCALFWIQFSVLLACVYQHKFVFYIYIWCNASCRLQHLNSAYFIDLSSSRKLKKLWERNKAKCFWTNLPSDCYHPGCFKSLWENQIGSCCLHFRLCWWPLQTILLHENLFVLLVLFPLMVFLSIPNQLNANNLIQFSDAKSSSSFRVANQKMHHSVRALWHAKLATSWWWKLQQLPQIFQGKAGTGSLQHAHRIWLWLCIFSCFHSLFPFSFFLPSPTENVPNAAAHWLPGRHS